MPGDFAAAVEPMEGASVVHIAAEARSEGDIAVVGGVGIENVEPPVNPDALEIGRVDFVADIAADIAADTAAAVAAAGIVAVDVAAVVVAAAGTADTVDSSAEAAVALKDSSTDERSKYHYLGAGSSGPHEDYHGSFAAEGHGVFDAVLGAKQV